MKDSSGCASLMHLESVTRVKKASSYFTIILEQFFRIIRIICIATLF